MGKLAKMLQLLARSLTGESHYESDVVTKWALKAKRIGLGHFPTSQFTAFALSRLALLSDGDVRDYCLLQAGSIYEVAYPQSKHIFQILFLRMLAIFQSIHNMQPVEKRTPPPIIIKARSLKELKDLFETAGCEREIVGPSSNNYRHFEYLIFRASSDPINLNDMYQSLKRDKMNCEAARSNFEAQARGKLLPKAVNSGVAEREVEES